MFGLGRCTDVATLEAIMVEPPEAELEIVGETTYRAAGFDTSKIKF
jgi:hypothetical protein